MPFEIIRNDITKMHVDAIVNTANPRPVIGSGVDAAIHTKAGPLLLAARKVIGVMNTGEARLTPGFRLPCKYVIHTVGPVWEDGGNGEARLLRQCYENTLKVALQRRCRSVAFPLISSGNYGFPKRLALLIAMEAIRDFLQEHEMQIYLVVFSKESLAFSDGLVEQIRSYVDDAYVQEREKAEYSFSVSRDFEFVREKLEEPKQKITYPEFPERMDTAPTQELREAVDLDFVWDADIEAEIQQTVESQAPIEFNAARRNMESQEKMVSTGPLPQLDLPQSYEPGCSYPSSTYPPPKRSAKGPGQIGTGRPEKQNAWPAFDEDELLTLVQKADAGFSETLLNLIDRSGEKDSDVYKRANIDRKLFSKIRNNPQYKPSKATAVAFAIALKLDLEETRNFIGRAGYALSHSSKFDIIIEYFITHGRYDIYEINMILFEFDQSLLGA